MPQNLPETGENTSARAVATTKMRTATILAQMAGDAMAWHVLGPPSGSLHLTSEQIRDMQALIRIHRDDSMGNPVACLESLWATLIDRLTEGSSNER